MRTNELEVWVLGIIDRVRKGHGIEDSRVELKSSLPEATKVARQLGGHANAAAGGMILWLIGVDEGGQIIGTNHTETTLWWAKVKARFDSIAPQLMLDLQVPYQGVTVSALLFDTTRAPYVITNSAGGPIQYEVPWREGTGTRTANRADLLRILTPLQSLPLIEVTGGTARAKVVGHQPGLRLDWALRLYLYMMPPSDARLVIPFHKCKLEFELRNQQKPFRAEQLVFAPPNAASAEVDLEAHRFPRGFDPPAHSVTARVTRSELLLDGPSRVVCLAEATTHPTRDDIHAPLRMVLKIAPALALNPVAIDIEMLPANPGYPNEYLWAIMGPDYFQRVR